MANRGIGSRRQCEERITSGLVKVNGQVVTRMGITVKPTDQIEVDGKPLADESTHSYVMLNKPVGYLSSAGHERGRRTVLELAPRIQRLYPVGRLDLDSEGLILLTDDGDLTYRLTHPRFGVPREYHVEVQPAPSASSLASLRRGVVITGHLARPAEVELIHRTREDGLLRFTMHEGRKRQLRLMCLAVSLTVKRLIRVRMGPLRLGSLKTGQHRALTAIELDSLMRSVGLAKPEISYCGHRA